MNTNIIVYAVCLVLVVTGASFWSYTMEIDEAEKDRVLARQQLAAAEDGVKMARGWLAARKEALALITAAGIIEQQNEAIRAELAIHQNKRLEVARSFITAIERGRGELIGTQIQEISLANGTRLHSARLQSIDPETAVILHSGGISKISTALLPDVVLDRFRFGYMPGGVGVDPTASISTSSTTSTAVPASSMSYNGSTSASDSLVRLGMDANITARTKGTQKKIMTTQRDPERVKIEGDPALWKSVERTSIGRAYVPGQGWLRIGSDGPIPGSARK